MASAQFSVNGSVPTDAVAVAASSTVNLALTSTTGVRTVAWSVVGAHANVAYPTITPAGSPSGATASFAMPVGASQCYRIQCVINGGIEGTESVAAYTATALVGVVNAAGNVPFALGEELERDTGYGWVGALNTALSIAAGETELGALVTALRAESGTEGQIRYLRGYTTAGDGGEGSFRWSATSAADDGGTALNAGGLGASSAGWRRIYAGPIDPRWFGCKCDGTTDDTDAWALVVTALGSGKTVEIPGIIRIAKGGWTGTLFDTKTNVTIQGIDNRRSGFLLDVQPTQTIGSQPWVYGFKFLSCSGIKIRKLNFANDAAVHSGFVGMFGSTDNTVEDCVFRDMPGDAPGVDPLTMAVASYNGQRNVIRNNRFERCHWAVCVGVGFIGEVEYDSLVVDNVFLDTTGSPINGTPQGCTIANNTIDNCGRTAIVVGGATAMTERLLIAGNRISGAGTYIQSDGIGGLPLRDITITGNKFFDGQRGSFAPRASVNGISCTYVYGITVADNEFVDVAGTTAGLAIGVSNSQDVLIAENRIRQLTAALSSSGINVSEPAGVVADRIRIVDNVIEGMGLVGINGGQGIELWASTHADSFKHVAVCGNTIRNCEQYGVIRYGTYDLTFDANDISGSGVRDVYFVQDGHATHGTNNSIGTALWSALGVETSIGQRVGHQNRIVYLYGPPLGPALGPPTVGTFAVGDRAIIMAPAAGSVAQYACTVAGTPGTWVAETYAAPAPVTAVAAGSSGQVLWSDGTNQWTGAPTVTSIAASSFVGIGASLPTTGGVRLANAAYIVWNSDPGGTDINGIGITSSENLIVGTSGTNGVANVYYDTKTSGVHRWSVNGATAAELSATGLTVPGFVGIGSPLPTTGGLRMANATYLVWDSAPTGTDINAFGVTSNENLIVGTSGTNGTNNTYYDVKSGGKHYFWVNTVEAATVDAAGLAVVGALSYEGGRVATASASGTATDGTEFVALEYTLPADCEADVTAVIKLHKSAVGKEIIVIAGDFETTSSTAAQLGGTDAVRHKPNTQPWAAAFAVSGAKVQVKLTLAADVVWSVSIQVVR